MRPKIQINIAHRDAEGDGTLEQVMGKICNKFEERVIEPDNETKDELLSTAVMKASPRFTSLVKRSTGCTLDLIGHSLEGVLYIGKWQVDARLSLTKRVFSCPTIQALKELNVTEVRLLA